MSQQGVRIEYEFPPMRAIYSVWYERTRRRPTTSFARHFYTRIRTPVFARWIVALL